MKKWVRVVIVIIAILLVAELALQAYVAHEEKKR